MPLFTLENLSYWYPEREKPALKELNLAVEAGEFLLVTGGSGSGKSSLARVLAGLIPGFYGGRIAGRALFRGTPLRNLDRRKLAREVGIVFQDPEQQIVQTQVEAEIAFGLENIGLPPEEMARRIAEVCGFMNLTPLRKAFTPTLSGGQKQKLALAAVLAMQPSVLILDEPTSQLDPVAAEEILNLVKRLNEEMGLTVILIEQRLERCFHLADRVLIMAEGAVACAGTPAEAAREAAKKGLPFLPPVARLFAGLSLSPVPVTVKEGRRLLRTRLAGAKPAGDPAPEPQPAGPRDRESVARLENVWFTYPEGREALKGVNLTVGAGEFVALLGETGAGKTTVLRCMAGLLAPGRGRITVLGRELRRDGYKEIRRFVAYLSQNPNDYLFQDTVEDEVRFTAKNLGLESEAAVAALLEKLELQRHRHRNPRDLSGGERQRVALAAVLVTRPRLILLDEPTRGLDLYLKAKLGDFLRQEAAAGKAVVVVTHDVEFAAEFATRVVLLADGRVVADGEKHAVLGRSFFYAPQTARLCRGICDGVLTPAEAQAKLLPLLSSARLGEER
ncbi:ABC transporter ATP-binding protein [Thermodesulfitimonas sp.]